MKLEDDDVDNDWRRASPALAWILMHALCNGMAGRSRPPLSRSNSGRLAQLIKAAGGAFSLARALFRSTVCRRG